jgi:hypothetical protein
MDFRAFTDSSRNGQRGTTTDARTAAGAGWDQTKDRAHRAQWTGKGPAAATKHRDEDAHQARKPALSVEHQQRKCCADHQMARERERADEGHMRVAGDASCTATSDTTVRANPHARYRIAGPTIVAMPTAPDALISTNGVKNDATM